MRDVKNKICKDLDYPGIFGHLLAFLNYGRIMIDKRYNLCAEIDQVIVGIQKTRK